MAFSRYVALGDSTTEGLGDPAPGSEGFIGFADRLAVRLARENADLHYANLAIRGRNTAQTRAEQLGPALSLAPDLASVVCGVNDILRPRLDLDGVLNDFEETVSALRASGATVMGMTFPDFASVMPVARLVRGRLGVFNSGLREIFGRHEGLLADFDRTGIVDRRLWSADLLHANAAGHARIAGAMAVELGIEPDDDPWAPLGPGPSRHRGQAAAATARWAAQDMGPWVVRRIRGQSSGDGRAPKQPELARVSLPPTAVEPVPA